MKKLFFLLTFLLAFSNFCFSENNTPEPYETEELPVAIQDLRRFEIISLGAVPFVMLDTTLVYSGYRWVKNDFSSELTPTPFAGNSKFSKDEQMGLVFTSLGISVGIGLTDLIVRQVKRSKKNKRALHAEKEIIITPISEDPDAILIKLPEESSDEVQVITGDE